MLDIFDQPNPRDLSNDRVWDLGDNKLHARREDPYGFWYLSYEKGPIPDQLSGAYTSFDEAERAVEIYLNSKKRDIKSLKQ